MGKNVKTERLPSDIQTEKFLLASVLLENGHMNTVRPLLSVEEFSSRQNQTVWSMICRLYDRGEMISAATVAIELERENELQSCGGLGYLMDLQEGIPQVESVDPYATRIKEIATMRRVAYLGQNLFERACQLSETSHELIGSIDLNSLIVGADGQGLLSAKEVVDKHGMTEILTPRIKRGLMSPWSWFNRNTHGLLPGELWVLAAHTGCGKSSAALEFAVSVARKGVGAAVFTMEMGEVEHYQRAIWQISRVDSDDGKEDNLTASERERVRDAANLIWGLPIYWDSQSFSMAAIHSSLRKKRIPNLGLIVIDYLGLIDGANRRANKNEIVGANARAAKLLANEFHCPVLLLAQFNRESAKPGKQRPPELTDLRDSGEIEQHANGVWFIHRAEETESPVIPMQWMIPKQRDGRRGIYHDMLFFSKFQSFGEADNGESR